MLGLGHSLVGGSLLDDSAYSMTKSFSFDGTDDVFLTNTVSGADPANGTIKPVSTSFSGAVWVRLDDGTTNPYALSDGAHHSIMGVKNNGGWGMTWYNRSFHMSVNYNNADDMLLKSSFSKAMVRNDGNDYNRYLYKSDHWHLVIFTIDMSDPSSEVIGNLYVDGNRAQAGVAAEDGSSGEPQYGSQPEDSTSKLTSSASGGDITLRYDSNSDNDEVDFTIGAQCGFTAATNVTSFNATGWTGRIGDVAVWEGVVLTQDDIANLYNLHVPIDMSTIQSSNLRGYWRPTKGLSDSVSGETGTLVDDSAIIADTPSLDVSGYAGYR
tara:strand:+ start:415 stop:1386 length:972 start_codon:yes stop_codon:yes gene_type:complete